MKLRALPAALGTSLALHAATMDSHGVELTGYADIGSAQIVCLTLEPGNRRLTLHPGESAEGIAVQQVDLKKGVVLVQCGTNRIRLRLVNRFPPGPSGLLAGSAPATGPSSSAGQRAAAGGSFSLNERDEAAGQNPSLNAGAGLQPWMKVAGRPVGLSAGAAAQLSARPANAYQAAAAGQQLSPVTAPPSPGSSGAFASASIATRQFSSATSYAANDATGNDNSTGSDPSFQAGPSTQNPVPDPVQEERQQIWILYGHDALMAWDQAHYVPPTRYN
jgi:hypothetical protein